MKKIIYSVICTLLLSKIVYASTPEPITNNIPLVSDIVSQLDILDYDVTDISYICIIGLSGNIYISDINEIDTFIEGFKYFVKKFDDYSIEGLYPEPVANYDYNVIIGTYSQDGIIVKNFAIHKSGKITERLKDGTMSHMWIKSEKIDEIIKFIENFYETDKYKYDMLLPLNNDNMTKLGVVFKGRLYLLSDAFLQNGNTFVSLDRWNEFCNNNFFKNQILYVNNNNIINNGINTGIKALKINGKYYIPLRKCVEILKDYTINWDCELNKIIINKI
ncbi:hypothetical protein B5E58_12265 [Tyzzerella sp. An114]|uniref:hypothetical protein n=1 Tax=Tyzzerella sp. An114 TaxID=1965545 RepID=UPI000B452B7E|nr:hypothetical protein [Tyzzerella sp. An114]OUQ55430.1 hypothetical protein B5E58_12265 [Tyzzerella sp. An114]